MTHINIITASAGNIFFAQWNRKKYPESEYDIRFNSDEDMEWDVVVVYENTGSHDTFKCRKGGLVFIAGEPPLMRPYPTAYLKQFDIVVLPKPNVRHPHHILSHGFLNWSLGFGFKTHVNQYSYEDLVNLKPEKVKDISIVTSSKAMMPGHVQRLRIIEQLKKDFPGQIDYFGAGHNPVEFKADALLPYRFHICMENCTIPYYWTEKFSDPVLAESVPIYAGCTNIDDYFHGKGYLTFNFSDYQSLKLTIKRILDSPKEVYHTYLPALKETKRNIMELENVIPFAINYAKGMKPTDKIEVHSIRQQATYRSYKVLLYSIKLKRFALRGYYALKTMFTNQ